MKFIHRGKIFLQNCERMSGTKNRNKKVNYLNLDDYDKIFPNTSQCQRSQANARERYRTHRWINQSKIITYITKKVYVLKFKNFSCSIVHFGLLKFNLNKEFELYKPNVCVQLSMYLWHWRNFRVVKIKKFLNLTDALGSLVYRKYYFLFTSHIETTKIQNRHIDGT